MDKKSQNLLPNFYSSRKPVKMEQINSKSKNIKKFVKNKPNHQNQFCQLPNLTTPSQERIIEKAPVIDISSFTKKLKKNDENNARRSLSPCTSSSLVHFKKQDMIENLNDLNLNPNESEVNDSNSIKENNKNLVTDFSELDLAIEQESENESGDDFEFDQEDFNQNFRNHVESLKQETKIVENSGYELQDETNFCYLDSEKSFESEPKADEHALSLKDFDDDLAIQFSDQHEHTDSKSDQHEHTDSKSDQEEYTDFEPDQEEYTDFKADQEEYTDFKSDQEEHTDFEPDQEEYTDFKADQEEYTDFKADQEEYTDFLEEPIALTPSPVNTSPQEQHSIILSPEEQHLNLQLLNLPEHVIVYYRTKGINCLMQWQHEALHLPGVLEGKTNLIFSAPTSAGKTIVSDILLIRSLMAKQKKGLIILPYISLANEKVIALEAMLKYSNLEVGGFMGNCLPTGRFPRVNIAVCTIEKANNIINRLIEEKKLDDLGIVIIDELHELGMSERGSILEQTLCKLMYLKSQVDIQIVGMSATMPNLEEIASWLNAASYRTDYRPIPLDERIVIDDKIIDAKTSQLLRKSDEIAIKVRKDGKFNLTCSLALETMLSNNGVLIFCESKNTSEILAQSLSVTVKDLFAYDPDEPVLKYAEARDKLKQYLKKDQLEEIIEQLKKCPSKLDEILRNTLPCGIAFHHAGLSMDEREILEAGFKNGSIKALFATPTLSSGVNLPARRVVINKAQVGISFLNALVYKQMTGRAGRKGIDTSGESFILANPITKDEERVKQLVTAPLEPIKSKAIEQNGAGNIIVSEPFKRLTLESIATGMLAKFDQIKSFLNMTLFSHQTRPLTDDEIYLILDQLISSSEATIQRLVDKKDKTEHYVASKLGQGILASSFPPDEALRLKNELESAMDGLCIKSNIHLLYYVIPNSNIETKWINWQVYRDILSRMNDANKESVPIVMKRLGINIGFIFQQTQTTNSVYTETKGKHIKFFLTLALNEVMKERPLKEVCDTFKLNRGELQSLQQRSSSYAGMLSILCKKLGWDMLSSIIKIFQDRLYFGISQELIELMNITCLNAQMARCLFDEGFVDVRTIARSNKLEIEKVLVSKAPENPDLRTHWVSNRFKSLSDSEISELIVNEARSVIEEEAGGKIMWEEEANFELQSAETSGSNRQSQDDQFDKTKIKVKYVNDNLSQVSPPSQSVLFHPETSDSSQASSGLSSPTKRLFSPFRRRPNRSPKNKRSNKYWDSQFRKKQRLSFEQEASSGNSATTESDCSVIFSNDKSKSPKVQSTQSQQQASLNSNCSNVTDPFEVMIESDQLNSGILTDVCSGQLSSFTNSCSAKNERDDNLKISSQSFKPPKYSTDVELFHTTDEDENPSSSSDKSDITASSASVGNVKATCLKLNDKIFYNSPYNQTVDEKCFEKINPQALHICNKIKENTGNFEFKTRTVNSENMDKFIEKFQSTDLFLINFKLERLIVQEKDFLTSKFRTCQDTRVTPNWLNKIRKMCFTFGDDKIYYLESNEIVKLFKTKLNKMNFKFKEQLVTGICYDAKVGYKILKCCIEMSTDNLRKIYWHDPKIGHWMLNVDADEPYSIFDIAPDYFDTKNSHPFCQKLIKYKHETLVRERDLKKFEEDARFEIFASILLIYPIMSSLKSELTKKQLYISYINVELPVLIIFAEMELKGFTLDREFLSDCLASWSSLNEELEKLIHNHLVEKNIKRPGDKRLNVRAPKDVKQIFNRLGLYEELVERKEFKLPEKAIKSLGTGREVLDKMRTFSPLAGWISDSRKLLHLIDSRDDLIKEMERLSIQNRVIGTYKHFMATGRIAMCNPNLLGIDRDSYISINDTTYQLSLKKVFKASNNYILVAADYCQLELRLLAVLSKDENLIDIFKVNKDPFKMIAARINNKNVNDVTQLERNTAKQMVYAIIYGQGLKRIAENLGVDDEDMAKEFLKEFHQAFPNLNTFVEDSKLRARDDGFIETLFGRRRYLPDIICNNRLKKASEERKAVNSRIQGSASDLVKLTMLKIDQALASTKIKAEILLQIHDELIFQVHNDQRNFNDFLKLLIKEMEDCEVVVKMKLPIKVKTGKNWSEMEEIDVSKFVN